MTGRQRWPLQMRRSPGPKSFAAAAVAKASTVATRSRPRTRRGRIPLLRGKAGRSSPGALGVLVELPRRRREDLPRDLAVPFDERAKVPRGHAVAAELRLRGHGRRPRRLRDQRDLAEVVARSQLADLVAAHRHTRPAVLDHEEADADLALFRYLLARGEGALGHRLGDPLELLVLQPGEEDDAPQDVDAGAHGASVGAHAVRRAGTPADRPAPDAPRREPRRSRRAR